MIEDINTFDYHIGCVMGNLEKDEVRSYLLKHGLSPLQIKTFKEHLHVIVGSFYHKEVENEQKTDPSTS